MRKLRIFFLAAVSAGCSAALLAGDRLGMDARTARAAAPSLPALDEAWAVAVQRDGKIVVAGSSTARDRGDFAIARYTRHGELDRGFGQAGLVVTDFAPSRQGDRAWAIAVQRNGRIVVAGQSGDIGREDFALARYRTDGRLDPSFGSGGKVLTDLGTSSGDVARAITLQPDGRIVAAGESDAGGNIEYALVRYTRAGVLDSSFGSSGAVLTGFGDGAGEGDSALSVSVGPDGKILAAGQSDVDDWSQVSLARYTPQGILDPTFGTAGKVLTPMGTTYYWAVDAALQKDGKIVASAVDDGENFVVMRYAQDGRLDPRFGTKGSVTTQLGKHSKDVPSAITTRGGGILVAGYTESAREDGDLQFALSRYTGKGRLNPGFGRRGKVMTDFGGKSADLAFDVAVDRSGKVIAVGSRRVNGEADFALARYTARGRLDRAFGKGGRAVTDFGSLN
jgi:uncharacterized delta-60 repeat protein